MTEKQMKKIENLEKMISSIDKKIEKLNLQKSLYQMSLESLTSQEEKEDQE